jgi:biotin transport system substrate-specific component
MLASFGYVLGFIAAAWVVGSLAERGWDRSIPKMFAAMLLGAAVLYVPGLIWLSGFIGFEKAIQFGLVPFLLADVVKAAVAALGFPAVWALLGRR